MGRMAVALIVSSWVIPLSILVNHIVPDPYMDEIFHVPQAQQYCKGNFRSWDPMITTPPGLYFVSLAHVACLFPGMISVNAALSFSEACTTSILRSTNGVLAVLCSILIYELITHLRPALGDKRATLYTVVLTLYPLHWFFTYLYYTDVLSLTAVLATYLVSLKKKYWSSALLGGFAVLVRQTNIIWILFIACTGVINLTLAQQKENPELDKSSISEVKDTQSSSRQCVSTSSNLRKRKTSNHVNAPEHLSSKATNPTASHSEGLFKEIHIMFLKLWPLKWELFTSFSPFFVILVAFVAFVYWNGSIVLGAKDAHTMSPHLAQLLYFSLASALFMAPAHFSLGQVAAVAQSFWKNMPLSFFQWCIAFIAGCLSVHFFSIAHPYLLADNRHYTFYLWRKVINFHLLMKYLLVPLYVYSWFSISKILGTKLKFTRLVSGVPGVRVTAVRTPKRSHHRGSFSITNNIGLSKVKTPNSSEITVARRRLDVCLRQLNSPLHCRYLRMANPFQKYRGFCNQWRSWSKREWAIAAAALALIILTFSHSTKYSSVDNKASPSESRFADWVPFTPLSNARKKGAFCLDGSVPVYHIQKGFGSGSQNWVLHIEGGSWCNTIGSCSSRKRTALGSSKYMATEVQFSGILSRDPLQNPDFFNWNKVKIRYCDGASFSGHRESEFKNGTELFFRGQLIWEALMDDLLSIGLSSARQAILTGCSAGGLATLIHCDDFRDVMPKDANVKCLADAGFFLNEKDVAGNHTIEQFYYDVVHLQGVEKSLNKDCLSRIEPHKCFFPQEFLKHITTPIFLVNPAYDFWQIQNILVPAVSDPQKRWLRCKLNIFNCSPRQMEILEGFRKTLLSRLSEFQQNEEGGMFINSCFAHCQTWKAETWHSPTSPRINNKTIAESVGDWYFNRNPAKHIDCRFPCNPTCYNLDFTRGL